MSKSILVIGGSGFLGTALEKVLNQKFENISFPSSKLFNLLTDNIVAKTKNYDTVINLTGQLTQPFSTCLNLNTIGVQKLIEASKENKFTLIQASTTLVYGTATKVDEQSPLNPESPYATAKAAAERMIEHQLPKDKYLILRFSNMYGPDQTKGLFWYLADSIKRGKEIVIPDNDGTLKRHYLHVNDAADMVRQLISTDTHGVVNVSRSEVYTIKELIKLCEEIIGKSLAVTYAKPAASSNIDRIKTDTLEAVIKPTFRHSVVEHLRSLLT